MSIVYPESRDLSISRQKNIKSTNEKPEGMSIALEVLKSRDGHVFAGASRYCNVPAYQFLWSSTTLARVKVIEIVITEYWIGVTSSRV